MLGFFLNNAEMAVKHAHLRWYLVQLCAIKITNSFKIKHSPISLYFQGWDL